MEKSRGKRPYPETTKSEQPERPGTARIKKQFRLRKMLRRMLRCNLLSLRTLRDFGEFIAYGVTYGMMVFVLLSVCYAVFVYRNIVNPSE